jgi:hypothetical protein
MKIKSKKKNEVPEVEFTQVLDEYHNYVVLYFDNEVDWLQAQTLLDIKPVKLMNTVKSDSNPYSKEIGVGRVLRGVEVFNRLLKKGAAAKSSKQNKG